MIVYNTLTPLIRQVGYLISYEKNFENLKQQVAKLKKIKEAVSTEVDAKRGNELQIYDIVQDWLVKVDKIIEDAENFCNDRRHSNVGCWPLSDLKSRHQLSQKSDEILENIAKVMQGKENIGPHGFFPNLKRVGSTSAASNGNLESRNKMKDGIVLALRDPNLSRIGVYGLGGVGKTALVEEIAAQVKNSKLFDEVVVANITQTIDIQRIQCEIADPLGLHFEEMTVVGRAYRLNQRIKNEKSILIILDDIWEILELDKLGIPMNHKGCKLLLISRNLDILQKMGTQKDFFIDALNEDEAWSLFEDMVGDVVKDPSMRDVAIKVVQRCVGFVVLIVMVARALQNKDDIDSWKYVLNQLKIVDKEGMHEKIYSAVESSYNCLEGDEVKELFLLCGLVGSPVHVEDLLKYGMGLGRFNHIYTLKLARLILHRLIGCLKSSCLLIESNSNEIVEMNDIVREVAVSIASRGRRVFKIGRGNELKKWPSELFPQRCTQIILEGCYIFKLPERLQCPNIELFILANVNQSLNVPDSLFEVTKNLKVLRFSSMNLPSLPQSFHCLIELKTLSLHCCVLGDISDIGALTKLQILSLKGSSMKVLPNELGQLTHLIMLDLTYVKVEIFPSNILSKLMKLEELYLGDTYTKWGQEDSNEENKSASLTELGHLKNLIALEIQIKGAEVLPKDIIFDKLERCQIAIGDVWEWSDNHGASKMFKLKVDIVCQLEHGVKELIKGVEDLYMDEVYGISNVLYDLNEEGFPLLKHLQIQNNGKIQYIVNSMEGQQSHVFFPKLESLILQKLNKLEKIWLGSFTDNSFTRLRFIKVQCCDQLEYLFSVLMVKALRQLVGVEVLECNIIKTIVYEEESSPNSMALDDDIEFCLLQSLTIQYSPAITDFYHGLLTSSTTTMQSSLHTNIPSSFFNEMVKFSNLETLKLSSINAENIWQDDGLYIANSFPRLANISVAQCDGLKYLFSASMFGSFPNLKKLQIQDCEMMEEIISTKGTNDGTEIEEVTIFGLMVGLPRLETMTISNMKRLKKVWHSQFKGLKNMEVYDCDKLENIFPSNMHTTFKRMETLKISNCVSVKEIFKLSINKFNSEEDTQLKKLHLLLLPKLKQIWSEDPQGNSRFRNLQDVHVEDCVSLEYVFPISVANVTSAKETLHLREMTLSYLPSLKHIWKQQAFSPLGQVLLPKLEKIIIKDMENLETIWHPLLAPTSIGRFEILSMENCLKIEHIFMCGAFATLETLKVDECSNLKHLVPSLITFNHLTYLEVQNCKGLIFLMTSSTAKSLVKLRTLRIRECDSIEQMGKRGRR